MIHGGGGGGANHRQNERMTDHVFIAGPASWNRIVLLDHLPEPVPHMQFALDDYETLGATSAGKALGLVGLGRPTVLHTLLGGDVEGERVRGLLVESGVELIEGDGGTTERHLNLMTPAGERVSLYLATPQPLDAVRPRGRRGDGGCRGHRARPRTGRARPHRRRARHRPPDLDRHPRLRRRAPTSTARSSRPPTRSS